MSKRSNKQKKRIALFMLPPPTTGAGAERYFVDLANALAEFGHNVDVVTLNESSFGKFVRFMNIYYFFNVFKKIDLTSLFRETKENVHKSLGNAGWKQTSFLNLKNTLQDYDIIYAKNEISELALFAIIGFFRLPPVVAGVHTPVQYAYINSFFTKVHNFVYSGFLYRWLLNKCSGIHVSNMFTKEYLQERTTSDVRLIYYPYLVDCFVESSKKFLFEEKFDKTKFNITYIARLCEQKGSDILINIINELAKDKKFIQKVKFNLFGSGERVFEEEFANLAKKYDWVRYYGHVENKYIANILSHQNLLISPARWEVSPFNILEAQAMGVSVLAPNIPGPADIVINNKTGYLTDDLSEYIPFIKDLVYSKITFDSSDAKNNIKEKFNPKRVHGQLNSFLLEKAKNNGS